jgi:hypothetical protein
MVYNMILYRLPAIVHITVYKKNGAHTSGGFKKKLGGFKKSWLR